MIVSAHQSQFLPWPPYFRKVAMSDIFVWMDSVQFQRGAASCVQNRNKIWSSNGALWLTVPVKKSPLNTVIKNIELAEKQCVKDQWSVIVKSYSNAPFWQFYELDLHHLFFGFEYLSLDEVNYNFFMYFVRCFGLNTKIVKLSDLNINSAKSDLVLNVCEKMNANIYLSGYGAKAYLDEASFVKKAINIRYLSSTPPSYQQYSPPHIAQLSMLDMMMNVSQDDIRTYLQSPIIN
jgi:hypothetical protein